MIDPCACLVGGSNANAIIPKMGKQDKHDISPEVRQRAKELRREQTPAEKMLWEFLLDRQLGGYKFRRQHPIGRFIVDFYCAEAGLVIELDGEMHVRQVEYDAARTQWLEDRDYHAIRFSNDEVSDNMEGVLERILEICGMLAGKTTRD